MAKLHFSLDGKSLGEFAIEKERMTIGRRSVNDIHIDNLAISGEHAVITTIGGDSFLEDLSSTNGTLVNGKSIKKHVLLHNDVIEFGKYQLLYINETQAKSTANASGFENTVVMRPAKLVAVPTPAKADVKEEVTQEAIVAAKQIKPVPDAGQNQVNQQGANNAATQTMADLSESIEVKPNVGRLQVINGANAGRELILNKAMTTLGKPGVQVAVITKRATGYFISHVEGDNLPFVNGQKIGPQAYALTDRDVVDLSGIKMEFFQS